MRLPDPRPSPGGRTSNARSDRHYRLVELQLPPAIRHLVSIHCGTFFDRVTLDGARVSPEPAPQAGWQLVRFKLDAAGAESEAVVRFQTSSSGVAGLTVDIDGTRLYDDSAT
jgi:hypothetical protein